MSGLKDKLKFWDNKKKGKTQVKPHERKNPKSRGTHRVSGHTRKLGKNSDVEVLDNRTLVEGDFGLVSVDEETYGELLGIRDVLQDEGVDDISIHPDSIHGYIGEMEIHAYKKDDGYFVKVIDFEGETIDEEYGLSYEEVKDCIGRGV